MEFYREQWVVESVDGKHVVSLDHLSAYTVNLYVDEVLIETVKIKNFLNFEYEFTVFEHKCSIVKLVTDKTIGFVVDGKYQNKARKYAPITKTPILTWIFFTIDFIALFVFAIYTCTVNLPSYNKVFFIMMLLTFTLALTYLIRIVSNSPCNIKNSKINLLIRCLLIIIIEVVYGLVWIGIFNIIRA